MGGCTPTHILIALLLGIGETATDEQKMAPIIFPLMHYGNQSPIEELRTLGALAHRDAMPRYLVQDTCLDQGQLPLAYVLAGWGKQSVRCERQPRRSDSDG
jgi:hypothetical protein